MGWLSSLLKPSRTPSAPRQSRRLMVELLEDRAVPSANVLQTNLVSDLPGVAQFQDAHLVNPWGISDSASTPGRPGSAFWISDNGAGLSTLYNTPGVPQSLIVSIPSPGDPLGSSGAPTGTVFNIAGGAAGGFKLSGVDKTGAPTTAAAVFLFATENGTIVGWNPGVNPVGFDHAKAGTYGTLAVDNSASGAVYKSLTIATDAGGRTLLYAADFHNNRIDVFDTNFKKVTTLPMGAFTDSNLPKGYAPFNVQELGGKIYVTYALQNDAAHDDVAGKGHGFVDVYNLDGSGGTRLVSRGDLNSPWGLALAPASFGTLAGKLLVGNFGDGHINVYDPTTGKDLGALKDPDGEPIVIDGLWSLKVGNGGNGGDADKVYFTAGLDHEAHGLFGSLTPVAAGTSEGQSEHQKVVAALDIVQLNIDALKQDLTDGVSAAMLTQALRDLDSSLADLARAELRFLQDAKHDQSGDKDSLGRAFGDVVVDEIGIALAAERAARGDAHALSLLDSLFIDLSKDVG
jgi:uncharacterized protein (TIGR03118 family)